MSSRNYMRLPIRDAIFGHNLVLHKCRGQSTVGEKVLRIMYLLRYGFLQKPYAFSYSHELFARPYSAKPQISRCFGRVAPTVTTWSLDAANGTCLAPVDETRLVVPSVSVLYRKKGVNNENEISNLHKAQLLAACLSPKQGERGSIQW
jgi:hypothetical protein